MIRVCLVYLWAMEKLLWAVENPLWVDVERLQPVFQETMKASPSYISHETNVKQDFFFFAT